MSLDQTDYAKAIATPSPNFWEGRQGYEVLYIVMHGTSGAAPGCVNWLCDPLSGGSVHYIVGTDGTIWQLVREESAAWGNGIPEPPSIFLNGTNPNMFTISIEHVRVDGPQGPNSSPITPAQQAASTALVADIRRRWGHVPLIPHSAISPESRAHCPGPDFPMEAIDVGASPPPPPAGVVRLSTPFAGTPQRLPLVFYRDWSFKHPAYTSGATNQTVLHFDQWTRGRGVLDATTGQEDVRWFHRANPKGACGWTPSAWINGNPA